MAGRLLAEWVSPPAPGGGARTIDKPDPENFWEVLALTRRVGLEKPRFIHHSINVHLRANLSPLVVVRHCQPWVP